MSQRYKGGVISATPPTTSTSSASGVWTEQQFMQGVASGSWPALAGAPTIGTATAGALSASVAFTAPTYVGSGITGYTATSSPGGFTGTGASSPVTVSGLTAGTAYTFTVTATTAAGQGPASAASNSVTPTLPNYIEDVFSTYLYTGNGSTQTITNGIDLSGNGGVTWLKVRNLSGEEPTLFSTSTTYGIGTNSTGFNTRLNSSFWSTTSSGFNLLSSNPVENENLKTYASWTFRKQNKFFDIATYTGDGSFIRLLPWPSNITDSTIGAILIKRTDSSGNWIYWHRTFGWQYLKLNLTDAVVNATVVNGGTGSNGYYVNDIANINGATYVAYFFAHNAGGFGLTGADNVISCGSFTTDGSGNATVSLGYEPQWILVKATATAGGNWEMYDNMRGLPAGTPSGSAPYSALLFANLTNAEQNGTMKINSTGFAYAGWVSEPFIYIAIRRGPMKVPTLGTSVFNPITRTGTGAAATVTTGNLPDWVLIRKTAGSDGNNYSRLTGNNRQLYTNLTLQEIDQGAAYGVTSFLNTAFTLGLNANGENQNTVSLVNYAFSRAPSVFDEVCYTGNGTAGRQITHNLGVAPELMLIKCRSSAYRWLVIKGTDGLDLSTTDAAGSVGSAFATTSTYFTVSNGTNNNASGETYVNYLFATCAGVSKVGSYTGTGATQTINCGFSGGARFVLIKRTDSTGGWYVWDTARGMVSGTDPSWFLNTGGAEVNADSVYTTAVGFQIVSTVAGINASGGNYLFLAIA